MNQSLKYNKLNRVYSRFKKFGLINKDTTINIDEISNDLDYLNKLLYDTYLIFNSEKSQTEKINSIHNLRDPDGKRLFTKKIARKVYFRYSEKLKALVNKLKQKRIKSLNNFQTGGEVDIKDNKVDKLISKIQNDPKFKADVIRVLQGYINNPAVDEVKTLLSKINFENIQGQKSEESVWDWVFFPLYKLENLPLVGFMFEIPLDMVAILLDNSDLILEGITPFLFKGLDIATDVGSGIPIPGVNTALASASLGLTLFQEPLEWFISDGLDVVGLFLNIQRKQWGLAYLSALEVIPNLSSIVDAAVTNMSVLNRHMGKVVTATGLVKDNILLAKSLTSQFYSDPLSIYKPLDIWDNVVYPNRDKVDFLKKLPIEELNNFIPIFKTIRSEITNFDINKIMEESLDSKTKIKPNL
tara:strand:+ start:1460 stop:2698 length:1239 start_codon:yes stop_codon:yes gene_type:complete